MSRLPTVSEMPRAVACAASVVKPRVPDDGEQSAAALRGSRIHAYIAARLRRWPMPELGKTKVKHIQLGKLRRYLGRGKLYCEPAFSYDGTRATFIAENVNRDYQRPGTLCGSADIVVVGEKLIHVVDIKTGQLPVPDPRDNWQLATLAMMADGAFNKHEVPIKGTIATLNRDGSWDFGTPHTWSLAELASIHLRIDAEIDSWREAHELEQSGWGATTTPGSHCRFCRAANCADNAFAKDEAA